MKRSASIAGLLLAFSLSALAQTTTLTLNLTFTTGVFTDIMTHWTDNHSGQPIGTAGSAIASGDTSITLSAPVTLAAGVAILVVDSSNSVEPMTVASAVTSSATVPVTRAFAGITPADHLSGVNIFQLAYSDPMKMLAAEVLQPWVNNIVTQLAQQNRSAQIPPLNGSYAVSH